MTDVLRKYDHLIFEEYNISTEALGLYRMLFAVVSLILIGFPNMTWLSAVPDFFYRPQLLNIAHLLSTEMPSYIFFVTFSLLPVICLVFLFFGYQTRSAGILFGLSIIVQGAFHSSLGKIDHNILYPATAIIMSFSGWGKCYSLDAKNANTQKRKHNGLPLFILALTIGFAFFTAGYAKFNGGWLDFSKMGSLHHFFGSYYNWERQDFLAPLVNSIENYWFWKIQDYLVVLFECLFIVAVIRKKYFQTYLVVALVFHTGVFLIFNITITSLFVGYFAFLPWQKITRFLGWERMNSKIEKCLSFKNLILSTLFFTSFYFLMLSMQNPEISLAFLAPLESVFSIDYKFFQTIVLYAVSWVFLLFLVYRNYKNQT